MPTEKIDRQKELLQLCLKLIEEKLGWNDAKYWQNRHFELLSEKIFEETHVQLSTATLKRLWGKITYHSKPNAHTLDTLAQFLGFENWIGFEYAQGKSIEPSKKNIQPNKVAPIGSYLKSPLVYGVAFSLMLIGLIAMTEWVKPVYKEKTSFFFQPVGKGLPNTVTFHYNIADSNADSVFIQQSWDKKLRYKADLNSDFFACTYYYPGFFKAKLILNDQVASEKGLYIKSEGWLGTIDKKPVPFYLDHATMSTNGTLAITPSHLKEKGFNLIDEIPITRIHLVEDFGEISSKNFKLNTAFKNTLGLGDAICQKTRILIICSESPIIIPFSIKGCVGEINLKTPDGFINGMNTNLSAFGVDFSDWVTLEVEGKGKQFSVWVNGQVAYQGEMTADAGKIVGIRYQFHGTGAVKSLQLKSDGKIISAATL